ncbi:MAG: endonuclease/exonuclease/phosphatase family protein [Alistipes sp.]|nr:endonuclease/exonuclease/phosphatase family protein [Alistipes sp.]
MGLHELSAQNQRRHVVAFYNVENLFDTLDDSTTADDDMLPDAERGWSEERKQKKIADIARVVADMGVDGQPPTIIGLAEVESRQVLEELTSHPLIADAAYKICHFDSPDRRGIDVALLYRAELFEPSEARVVPISIDGYALSTRDILAVRGRFCGEETLFIVNHWPSRIGGVWATEHLRIACARQLKAIIYEARQQNGDIKIVTMGDMNDNPSNRSQRRVVQARHSHRHLSPNDLYNPLGKNALRIGSSRYNGKWNHYDNIIISANLVDTNNAQISFVPSQKRHSSAFIFRRDYMCNKRGYPLRTYQGSEYLGGTSDHLPICLILQQSLN